ncbi:AAA family ATPase [Micromonospora sp. NBC_01813]|uniref:AAA family ATPase n=1 Tax=Micromonospora sp. NBC_01813 TaxID=2975988 RepID=UPI002DDA4A02|nr:AAA family ATPase [Micromonospora sp. NBC_01813]WSA11730.1 ATP-binding protein [Micromonospora sp. NBC_01813]
MPRLILLNGPPACGKSTLARRYVEDHPLALDLDIDRIRDLLGGWAEQPQPAGLLARSIALAAARTHLSSGHDVVIPQLVAQPVFIDQVEQVAHDTAAIFHEVLLLDTKENAIRRFVERTARGETPAHRHAAEMLERQGGVGELAALYDRLLSVVAARPATQVVQTHDGEPDQAYQDFLACLP